MISGNDLVRAVRGPIILITIGTLFALDHFTPYGFPADLAGDSDRGRPAEPGGPDHAVGPAGGRCGMRPRVRSPVR